MSLSDFEKEKMEEFDKRFGGMPNNNILMGSKNLMNDILISSLRQSYTLGQEEERKAWLNDERCVNCGNQSDPNTQIYCEGDMSSCKKCFETA